MTDLQDGDVGAGLPATRSKVTGNTCRHSGESRNPFSISRDAGKVKMDSWFRRDEAAAAPE
jgi:hypothetical protein